MIILAAVLRWTSQTENACASGKPACRSNHLRAVAARQSLPLAGLGSAVFGSAHVRQHGHMESGDHTDRLHVRSWITPKAIKGASAIEGQGVHAVEAIAAGEVVAVKGGHIVSGSVAAGLPEAIRNSGFQIGPDQFLAALDPEEYDGVMMRVNHSCDPNVGMGGNVLLVSMRNIAAGEELTIDYALFLADPGFTMQCRCGATACRGVLTGTDWMRAELQQRYQGWFSWWLQQKIARYQAAQ